MADVNLDPRTRNEDIGVVITESHLIPQSGFGVDFGFLATIIKAQVAGDVIWFNRFTNETGVWNFESGEAWPIACTKILANANIDGVDYTTAPLITEIWIAATANSIASPND